MGITARYASRKFLMALLIVLLATVLCYLSLIDGGMWVTVVSLALTVYVGGNVAQKATTKPQDGVIDTATRNTASEAWQKGGEIDTALRSIVDEAWRKGGT